MSVIAALVLVVHVSNLAEAPPLVVRDAQAQVSDLFRDVGVRIEWVDDVAGGGYAEARLVIVPRAVGALSSSFVAVLGAASRSPGGSGTAWVFYDRIADHAERHAVPLSRLLACAIAHELGHVLQRRPAHANSGVMRASWSQAEYRGAALGRLRFTQADAAAFNTESASAAEGAGRASRVRE